MDNYVTVNMEPDADQEDLLRTLDSSRISSDAKRIVFLGEISRELLHKRTEIVAEAGEKVQLPYAVHAAREDGERRTWLVSARDAARKLAAAYRKNGGSAAIQDTRKE